MSISWTDFFKKLPQDVKEKIDALAKNELELREKITKELIKIYQTDTRIPKDSNEQQRINYAYGLLLDRNTPKKKPLSTEVDISKSKDDNSFLDDIMDKGESKVKILSRLSGIIHDEKEDIFYNCVFVQKEGKYSPIIVTSKGKILKVEDNTDYVLNAGESEPGIPLFKNPNQVPDDLRYQFFVYNSKTYKFANRLLFDPGSDINTVNNQVIHDIINKKYAPKEIFNDIVNEIKKFYYHDYSYEYDVMGSAVIQSYIYNILGKIFYLIFLGEPDSGKTVGIGMLSNLCHNGLFSGKNTVPVSCRLIHLYGVTLCHDEFEKISPEEKKTLVGIFNSGFTRDGCYRLVNPGEKDIAKSITSLKTFCPKYFTANGIKGFDASFIDRCYIIQSVRMTEDRKDFFNLSKQDNKRFQTISNNIFNYCLFNWKGIEADIDYVRTRFIGKKIYGRQVDKLSIILGIIMHFKGEKYAIQVRNYIKDKIPIDVAEEFNTMEEIILDTIVEKYNKKYQEMITIPNKYLYEQLCYRLGLKPSDMNAPNNQKPRYLLRQLGIVTEKSELGCTPNGARRFHINTEKLRKALLQGGYSKLLSKFPSSAPQKPQSPQSK